MSNAQEIVTREDVEAPTRYADPIVSMIERVVMDPSIPIDRLKEMLAMKERLEDRARESEEREAKKAYFSAMSKCQEELPVVIKNKKNTHTNSIYADLAAIEQQAMPIIHKHGFGVSFQPDGYNEKGELLIKWEISHEAGHSRSDIAGIPIDAAGSQGKVNKTGTQAFGSTATYGRRYLLCMLFNISTGDDNDGNRSHHVSDEQQRTLNAEQIEALQSLIVETGADIPLFLKWMKVKTLSEIDQQYFETARKGLEAKRDQK